MYVIELTRTNGKTERYHAENYHEAKMRFLNFILGVPRTRELVGPQSIKSVTLVRRRTQRSAPVLLAAEHYGHLAPPPVLLFESEQKGLHHEDQPPARRPRTAVRPKRSKRQELAKAEAP
jgi:hypothetical protein